MESPAPAGSSNEQFHFEDGGRSSLEAAVASEAAAENHSGDVSGGGGSVATVVTMSESFAPDTRVIVTSSGEHFSISSSKAIDLLGEEFVTKLKAEPVSLVGGDPSGRMRVVTATMAATASAPPTTTVAEATAAGTGNIVYCNLNDLDLAESAAAGGDGGAESYSFASLHSLADASSVAQQQERSPYSAVSSILLQGGILQLKSDSGEVGGIVAHSLVGQDQQQQQQQQQQHVLMTVDSKFASAAGERLLPTQFVAVNGSPPSSRPQDAIASILASMNTMTQSQATPQAATLTVAAPLDYSTSVTESEEERSVGVDMEQQFESSDRPEILPLNLATSQHATVIQSPQSLQVQGIKRIAQSSVSPAGLVTKKVIIATINGTQRILTPVSSPQMIALKSAPRLLADGTLVSATTGAPITILQKSPISQATMPKPKPVFTPTATIQTKTVDNKTCRWKFENGQICGKVFTKTYNLTVHMRMHQDIRPFPCTVCEQTFRQKAHLQRHEATHGIDSMANRKRRKRPLTDENGLEILDTKGVVGSGGGDLSEADLIEAEEEDDEDIYRPYVEKRKFVPATAAGVMKTERDSGEEAELDPMIEPIVRPPPPPQPVAAGHDLGVEKKYPVNVGTNTEAMARHHVVTDEIEESTLEPVQFSAPPPPRLNQVEQGVQYCEEDLLQGDEDESYPHHQTALEVKYAAVDTSGGVRLGGVVTGRAVRDPRDQGLMKCERVEPEEGCDVVDATAAATVVGQEDGGDGGEVAYTSQEEEEEQEQHYRYVTTVHDGGEVGGHLIAQTADGNYIDASGSQLVMSHDGELVGFVPIEAGGGHAASAAGQSQVVNISTSTNEHGQQVVIIENLHNHSPELQQEILRALMSDTSLIPIANT